MKDKITILVTGGAGYIGSHTLIEILETTRWNVISADNFMNSKPVVFERIKKITGKLTVNYDGDLCDHQEVRKIFLSNNISGIIHFAALKSVPESVQKPELYMRNNMHSLQNILSCMKEFNVRNLIFSSSCSVYGNIRELPVREDTPLQKAESPYAETKQLGEKTMEKFFKENPSFQGISLRYFNPVGAHPSGEIGELPLNPPNNLLPLITGSASGKYKKLVVHGNDYGTRDGTCIRDYIHVSDIASAHVLALKYLFGKRSGRNYDVVNLGSGTGVTVLEAIRSFEKVSGSRLNYETGPRRAGDVEAIYSDPSKAEKLLEWRPRYSLDEMMRSAWKWELNKNTKE